MAFSNSIPIGGSGLPNVVTTINNSLVTANNAAVLGQSGTNNTAWSNVTVNAIYSATYFGATIALATGNDPTGQIKTLAFTNVGGTWLAGQTAITGISSNGISEAGSSFLFANGFGVFMSPMDYQTPGPGGGLSATNPVVTNVTPTSIPVTALSTNLTQIVGTSSTNVGTWTPSSALSSTGTWAYNVGEAKPMPTGHYSTSYTFPGYTGANPQVQLTYAVPNGDNPPTVWDQPTVSGSVGYYGITGSPTFSVNWV